MKESRTHETTMSLPAPPEEVWKALTDAGFVKIWYAPEARIEPKEGGEYFVSWGLGMEGHAKIETFVPNERLGVVSERTLPGSAPVRMAIEFLLEGTGGGTTLRLVHSGFLTSPDWDNEFEGTRQGWPMMLRILKYSLAEQRGKHGKQRWLYAQTTLPAEKAWQVFTSRFAGVTPEYAAAPKEFAAAWTDFGPGLVYAAFGESGDTTGISLFVVLYGEAVARMDEAAAYWQARLAELFPAAAASQPA